ncbi:MAG: hypothetical protein JNM17_21650 [Archangium sp.]|nr:hypothetical protein [Archangium sp.]
MTCHKPFMAIDLEKLLAPHELGAWATLHQRPKEALKHGKALLEHAASGPGRQPANAKCWAIFLALIRSKTKVPPAFDALFPVPTHRDELPEAQRCLEALPGERRDAALLGSLERVNATVAATGGLVWLSVKPELEIARVVFRRSKDSEIMTRAKVKPVLAKLAAKHPDLKPALTGR